MSKLSILSFDIIEATFVSTSKPAPHFVRSFAKITVKANAIDTAKGTRQMSVTVTSKGRVLDFS